uniref:Uncharacterized protein n=1 Tax=Callorhinchus milii TaxID=7868 RepID=A0A4W3IZV4_CALMI
MSSKLFVHHFPPVLLKTLIQVGGKFYMLRSPLTSYPSNPSYRFMPDSFIQVRCLTESFSILEFTTQSFCKYISYLLTMAIHTESSG